MKEHLGRKGRAFLGRSAAGFTLLEAIIAMTIIGAAMTSILLLQARLTNNISVIERTVERAAWRKNITETAAALSAENMPGPLVFPDAELSWRETSKNILEHRNRIRLREEGPAVVSIGPVEFSVTRGAQTLLKSEQLVLRSREAPAAKP